MLCSIRYSNFKLRHFQILGWLVKDISLKSWSILKMCFLNNYLSFKTLWPSHTTYATLLVFHPQSFAYGASIQSANPIYSMYYIICRYILCSMYYSRESWGCSADMSQKETNEWCSSRTCVVAASLLFLRTLLESPQFSLVKVRKDFKR